MRYTYAGPSIVLTPLFPTSPHPVGFFFCVFSVPSPIIASQVFVTVKTERILPGQTRIRMEKRISVGWNTSPTIAPKPTTDNSSGNGSSNSSSNMTMAQLQQALVGKASAADLSSGLDAKADKEQINSELELKADRSDLNLKADINHSHSQYVTIAELQAGLATKDNAKLALTKLAGRNLSAHRVVTIDDNDLIIYADNTIEAHAAGITGLTATAANQGDPVAIVSYGEVSDDSWTWTEQKPIFLSTEGSLTQSVPSIGFVLQVAKALTPQKIFVSIKTPYLRMP